MPNIGDIVLVHSTPPHIGSVTSAERIICEDATIVGLNDYQVDLIGDALSIIQQLERSVLAQYGAG